MSRDRKRVQEWLDAETARLLTTVETFRHEDLRAPSVLLDWSVGHLLTHIARNADALCNLLHWARTGIETPMYESTTARNDDIDRGALRVADVIVDDVMASASMFSARLSGLSEDDWQAWVRTAQGRTIAAAEILWLRLREVTIHHVDLGARVEDLPLPLTVELLTDVVETLRAKPTWPRIELKASDSGYAAVDATGSGVLVLGTTAQLLGWLTGRFNGEGLVASTGELPGLPNWL